MIKLSKQSVPTYIQSTTSQTAACPMSKPTEHIQTFKTDKPSDIRSILQQLSQGMQKRGYHRPERFG
jgi:hypothetical protein